MTKSLGQKAFGVLEDVLLEEIVSENKSIQENINDLKTCQQMLEEVRICIGKETHTYSILDDGVIGPDESMQRDERNQGNIIKFTMDRFESPTITLDTFKTTENDEPILFCKSSILSFEYPGSFCSEAVNELRMYMNATEDEGTASFYFCGDGVTFQGTLHNVGPKDMATGIEDIIRSANAHMVLSRLSARYGVEAPEFRMDAFFRDSPELYFELESFSTQFTPEVSTVYELAHKIKETKIPEVNSIDSADMTASNALWGQVAMSLVQGKLVDGLSANKKLRCELKSRCYMKSLLQNAILKYDGEILHKSNLNKGMLLSDHLRENGEADRIGNGNEVWRISLKQEELSIPMNWLDKFTITIGANCRCVSSLDRALVHGNGRSILTLGDGDVKVFGKIDCSFQRLHDVMNEDVFQQKLSKATLHGVSADFPEWFKMEVTEIRLPVQIVKMFLDIGK